MSEVNKIKIYILLFILIAIGGLVLYGPDYTPRFNKPINHYETN